MFSLRQLILIRSKNEYIEVMKKLEANSKWRLEINGVKYIRSGQREDRWGIFRVLQARRDMILEA